MKRVDRGLLYGHIIAVCCESNAYYQYTCDKLQNSQMLHQVVHIFATGISRIKSDLFEATDNAQQPRNHGN
jgi:hypothetical protein